jgi:hypothetical protein
VDFGNLVAEPFKMLQSVQIDDILLDRCQVVDQLVSVHSLRFERIPVTFFVEWGQKRVLYAQQIISLIFSRPGAVRTLYASKSRESLKTGAKETSQKPKCSLGVQILFNDCADLIRT